MVVCATHWMRYIGQGLLLVCLVSIGLTIASPASAGYSKSVDLSTAGLRFSGTEAFALPHNPGHNGDTPDDILENERDDNLQGDSTPVYVIDHFYVESLGVSGKYIVVPLFPATTGNSFRLSAIYLLTQRLRI